MKISHASTITISILQKNFSSFLEMSIKNLFRFFHEKKIFNFTLTKIMGSEGLASNIFQFSYPHYESIILVLNFLLMRILELMNVREVPPKLFIPILMHIFEHKC